MGSLPLELLTKSVKISFQLPTRHIPHPYHPS